MRFGVNMRRLEGQRLGIGRYLENLLKHWNGALHTDDSMVLYLREHLREQDDWIQDRFETDVVSPRLTGMTWENVSLLPKLRDIDVFFGPSYSLPLAFKGPTVVAIHSLNETTPGAHPWWHHFTYTQIYKSSAAKAYKVIVPSPSVLEGVHTHYEIPYSKLEVVREGAPDNFSPITDENILRQTRIEYTGSDKPYILFVGKFSTRRNIPLLVRAFAELKKRHGIEQNLLLLGPNHLNLPLDSLVDELGVRDSVTITHRSFSDHNDIIPVFSAADLYAFPSLNEGASNTVVEAMSCGVPVVAGRCDAIADIAEGCGTLIDTISCDTLTNALAEPLLDRKLWASMRERGLAKAATLRWSTNALRTLEILHEAVRG